MTMNSSAIRRRFFVLLFAVCLSIPATTWAQEGDPAAGRGPGQEIFYITAETVARIRYHERFKGFMVFGSWFRSEWFTDEQIGAADDLRVFVGHGRQDGVVDRSTMSRDILEGHGYDVTLFDYEGGHMIAESALDAMFEWIEAAEDRSSTSR